MSQDQTVLFARSPTSAIAEYLRRSISISKIIGRIWSGRLIIIAVTSASLVYGAWKIHAAGPTFTATMSISPAESDIGGGGGGGASGILAGLTGGNSGMSVSKFTQFLASLSSVEVAKILDAKYGMLCKLYPGDCDQVTHQWREQTGAKVSLSGLIANLGGLPDPNGPRTAQDLANYISAQVVSEPNKNNSIVVLHFTNSKPEFAQQFLSSVVAATNDYVKTLNRETNRRYVNYLNQAVVKATNIEQRQTLDALLLQQERQLMLTEVDVPYAATILDGPSITPVNRIIRTLLIYAFGGFVIGVIIANFRHHLPLKWRL
jgi:hypothetical protein